MTNDTKVPERKLRHKGAHRVGAAGSLPAIDRGSIAVSAPVDNPAWRIKRPPNCAWPFKPGDISPLKWWRTLPSDAFRDAEQVLLLATLERIRVLHGSDDLAAALTGDAAAAIDVAFALMPIDVTTLATDIAMSALMRCALAPNATAALVMAQIVGLTILDLGLATELAASWYSHGLHHSSDPHKFSQAETALLAAFRDRHYDGESP
ncbi:hypothetical protein [Bradyrhizobium diazoefficiens]|uniref:hypothetical protein n=1 Tax=Bradyrhizobium diazoefficiens TaxID=1355477 RepID=UPI00347153EA